MTDLTPVLAGTRILVTAQRRSDELAPRTPNVISSQDAGSGVCGRRPYLAARNGSMTSATAVVVSRS